MGSASKATKARLDLASADQASATELKQLSIAGACAIGIDDANGVRQTIARLLEHRVLETSPVPLAIAARLAFLQGLTMLLKADYERHSLLGPSLAERSRSLLSMEAFFTTAKECALKGQRFRLGHCHAATPMPLQ